MLLRHEVRQVAVLYAAGLGAAAIALTAADAATAPTPEPAEPAGARAVGATPTAAPSAGFRFAPAIAFVSPIRGEGIDSPFGLRRLPWEAYGRLHAGIDIAAAPGAPVHAAAEGVVAQAGKSPSYGHFVEILHAGGLRSLYAHMSSQTPGLRRGARLERGRVIGFVGSTGRSTGAHLHFEIRKGARPLNPALFIGRSFARFADLPIAQAARYPRRIHVAYVSRWPRSVLEARAAKAKAAELEAAEVRLAEARAAQARGEPAPAEIVQVAAASKPAAAPASTPIEGVKVTPLEGGRVRATITLGS